MSDSSPKTFFSGEMQLAGWSESHSGGCKVSFWLSSPEDLDAFRLMTVRKGNQSGQRIMAALVEIGDDELPVIPDAGIPASDSTRLKDEPKLGDAAWLAVQWCNDPQFWEWIESVKDPAIPWVCKSEQDAKKFICTHCEIDSRKYLDTNQEALRIWNEEIRKPFRDYRAEHGYIPRVNRNGKKNETRN